MRAASFALVVLLLFSTSTFAQRRATRGNIPSAGPSDGRGEVVVRVVGTDDRRMFDQQFQVQLLKDGVPIQTSFCDSSGTVRFRNVSAGTYVLRVTAVGFEAANVSFDVMGSGEHSETVQVRHTSEASAQPASQQPTISASDLQAPEKAKKELAKGDDAMQRRQFPKAIEHFRKAVDLYPRYVTALNNLGAACMAVEDWVCGRDSLEKAVAIDPNWQRSYVNLARIRMREQNLGDAEKLLQKATAIDPLNAEALTMLALSELLQGKLDDAIAHGRKVHTLPHAGWALAHLVTAQALEAKQLPSEAVAEYNLFVQEAPDHPNVPKARQAIARLVSAGAQH